MQYEAAKELETAIELDPAYKRQPEELPKQIPKEFRINDA